MSTKSPLRRSLLLAATALFLSCAGTRHADGVFPIGIPEEADGPRRLRYSDGQVSANKTCMIRLSNPVSASIPPAYVNGRPLGFC